MNTSDVADVLERHRSEVIDTWAALGPDGPTLGSAEAGDAGVARERFLVPLAQLLFGALRGSQDHLSVYLDERQRYLPSGLSRSERADLLRRGLDHEIPAFMRLCEGVSSGLAAETLRSLHDDLLDTSPAVARLLFVGDCLFVETRAFLAPLALRNGDPVDVHQSFFSARQPLSDRNDAIVSLVKGQKPDLIGMSLFSFEGIPPYQAAWQQAATPFLTPRRRRELAQAAVDMVSILDDTIQDIRSVTDSTVVVHAPGGLPLDRYRRRLRLLPPHSSGQRFLLSELRDRILELAQGSTNVMVLDESDLLGDDMAVRRAAEPAFDPADVPSGYGHTSRFGSLVADRYAEIVADWHLLGRAKAVFVDFDNTLWSGVMADGTVTHDRAGQQLLKDLRQAGVLLIALSKNDPASIRWNEMVLEPDDFAVMKINWAPKPDNVAAAIHELDLAPEAFVLLDDNPVERALVQENVVGVKALDPTTARTWTTLRRWLDFPSTTQTTEAARRTAMYREAAERRAALGTNHDYPAMMASLKLRYELRQATPLDLPRLLELVQRTNQFNTTTKRRSADELGQLLDAVDTSVYVATLRDRFGDLGVVATAIFDRPSKCFDSLIMSCRAMGFGLEQAVVTGVIDREVGPAERVRAVFVPTDRNGPAASVFEQAGFVAVSDHDWELARASDRRDAPTWLS